jgi:hypothetical protein
MPLDYILRMIEQFGLVWRRLLRLKEQREAEAGLAEIDAAYGKLFGYNAGFIDLLPDDELVALARDGDDLDPDRAGVLAALHSAEGDFYNLQGRIDDAFRRYERAALLYGAIPRAGKSLSRDLRAPAAELAATLELYVLDPPLLDDLWRIYAALDRYADAENVLWNWLEQVEFDPACVADALSWYAALLQLPDRMLSAGNLPRSEVQHSIAQLETAVGSRMSDVGGGLPGIENQD